MRSHRKITVDAPKSSCRTDICKDCFECTPVAQKVSDQFGVASHGSSQAVPLVYKARAIEEVVVNCLVSELAGGANWGLSLINLMQKIIKRDMSHA